MVAEFTLSLAEGLYHNDSIQPCTLSSFAVK